MDSRDAWKLVHMLYGAPSFQLPTRLVQNAGFRCGPDVVGILDRERLTERVQVGGEEMLRLTDTACSLVSNFLLACKREDTSVVSVDVPRAFVVMPFSEPWSDAVFTHLIEPAVKAANLRCIRGDQALQVGELSGGVWREILAAGIIVAEVSLPNANVYYELGLAHVLGKETFLMKQRGVKLPADFGGALFTEYEREEPSACQDALAQRLREWGDVRRAALVGQLLPDRV